MLYFKKTPWLLKKLYPDCLWNMPSDEKTLYLSFDDGPHPQVTEFVLTQLEKYHAKATFFCVGENIKAWPSAYQKVLNEGHRTGNHTFHHLNGWKTNDKKYIEDIAEASKIIDSNLFRPPYGKITRFQLKAVTGERLKMRPVMWDVLSGDFDPSVTGENCYLNVINNAQPGSIVVFHDSLKSFSVLQYALPRVLQFYSERNFQFRSLPFESE